ncbi:MAG: hypothetical protein ABIR19_11160 [Ginsengibacter sp.]
MNTQQLTGKIFERLKKFRYVILVAGITGAAFCIFYARQQPVTYTSKSSVFPLNGSGDNSGSSSALSALLGAEASKSFSEDASVNIIELAQSRTTREEVAAMHDTAMGNKTIAELLLKDYNEHRGWFEKNIAEPGTRDELITWAGEQLKYSLNATINKNNTLVLTYTGRSVPLVKAVSYGFISKISLFYIELKREKASRDYQFATSKVDSLRSVMNNKDRRLIAIDKKTLFTNTNKLEYRVPTENLLADKQMIRQQYAQAVANQQNAAYKLQKATPLIKVLDQPDPPYDVKGKSSMLFGIIGFLAMVFTTSILVLASLLLKFGKQEINKSLFGTDQTKMSAAA